MSSKILKHSCSNLIRFNLSSSSSFQMRSLRVQPTHSLRIPFNLIRSSTCDKCSGSVKVATHLGHISRCKTASGTDYSKGWTYRVCIKNTRRDYVARTPSQPNAIARGSMTACWQMAHLAASNKVEYDPFAQSQFASSQLTSEAHVV